jgi:hypothetical protein
MIIRIYRSSPRTAGAAGIMARRVGKWLYDPASGSARQVADDGLISDFQLYLSGGN